EEESNDDANGGAEPLLPLDDLLSNLKDLFLSEDSFKHAREWDSTFEDAKIMKRFSDKDILVHWKFKASPLSGRDMLYIVTELHEEGPPPSKSNPNDNEGSDQWVDRWMYAYASVSDDWAKNPSGEDSVGSIEIEDGGKRVRALNCFPSCDRITAYRDGQGRAKVQLDHLMTTDVGGWIGPLCFNNLFKKALIQANAHESEAMREYALLLCQSKKEKQK
ncbi:hypothetical protein THAOC_14221, partial [Thalassiosira oceanica]